MAKIKISNREGYKTEIFSAGHFQYADEPLESGGTDEGMNPYELLLASLGSCKAMTMRMYAQRKNFQLKEILINLTHKKIYAEDCLDCESIEGKIDKIKVEINLGGDLNEEQRNQIFEISKKCPVHKTLISETKIDSILES